MCVFCTASACENAGIPHKFCSKKVRFKFENSCKFTLPCLSFFLNPKMFTKPEEFSLAQNICNL